MDYIVLSIPVFFILIGVELLVSKLRHSGLYRFSDAITNISCGIAQQITNVFAKTVLIVGYVYLYDHWRIFDVQETWITWIALFIGVDFFYYWFHRLSHEINLFWGAHIVHHQSEDYNLSVALRQSSLQGFVSMAFYLPLAILGFNPVTFVTISAFQTLYQFWIHTKTINRLPSIIEFVFNTPSHHRVHHGRNPKYIDRNHGGTLIIFDRIFGTFQAEEEEVIYGVTKPLASWNPVWANVDYFVDMWRVLRQPMRWRDRLKYLVAEPGWHPEYLGGWRKPEEVDSSHAITYDTQVPVGLNYYVLLQYLLVLGVTSGFLFNLEMFDRSIQVLISAWIILSIATQGGLLEKRKWSLSVEIVRLLAAGLLTVLLFKIPPIAILGGTLIILGSTIWLLRFRSIFQV